MQNHEFLTGGYSLKESGPGQPLGNLQSNHLTLKIPDILSPSLGTLYPAGYAESQILDKRL